MTLWKEKCCNKDMSKSVPNYFTKIHTLPGIDLRIILKWSIRIGLGGMDCIDQAQVSDR
jgi:hypothetical protein